MDENKPLSPQEEKELADLESMDSQSTAQLSPDEDAELAKLEAVDAATTTESASAGLIQGLTFEFGDEIAGSFGAVKDTARSGNISLTDFYQSYKQNRDNFRKAFDELEKANPGSFGMAKAAGAFASTAPLAALTGGAALPAGGALLGLGETEDITDLSTVIKDVSIDAALSVGVGAAGKAVTLAGSAAAQQLKNVRTLVVDAFDGPLAKELKNLIGSSAIDAFSSRVNAAKNIGEILLSKLSYSPQVPSQMSESLRKVGTVFVANPERWNLIAARMALAAQASTQDMIKELAGIESSINLEVSPLIRTTEDVLRKRNSVLTMVESVSPQIGGLLQDAIANNDSQQIGSLMSMASVLPAAKRYVLEGIGWDGKVFTPEETALVENNIQSSRKPAWQKKQEIEDLRTTGQIPIMETQPYYVKEPVRKNRDLRGKKLEDF